MRRAGVPTVPSVTGDSIRSVLSRAVTAAVVGAVAIALWIAYDVGGGEIARFVSYEAAFVVLPGVAAHLLLRPGAPWREQLVYGWALGYAVEIGAYSLVAELGIRSAFLALPFLGAALLGVVAWRRRLPPRPSLAPSWGPTLAGGAVACVALIYIALDYFARAKLPWRVDSASYTEDFNLHLGLAGDALHHWPITEPSVSGEPKFYHLGVDVHLAAIADVTGLRLPLILFRLALVPLTLVFLASVCVAARSLFRSPWVGPVAIGLAMLVGDADLETYRWPFFGLFSTGFWISPSFTLGTALFIPPVAIIARRLTDRPPVAQGLGEWLVVAAFLAAAVWSKATTGPVITAGLLLYLLYRRERNAVAALALVVAVDLVFYAAFYHHSSDGLRFDPPGALQSMPRGFWIHDELMQVGFPSWLAWTVATPVGILGMVGPALVGVPALLWLRRRALEPVDVFFTAMLAVGLACSIFLFQPGGSETFFTHYGYAVGCLLSAEGLLLLLRGRSWLAVAAFTVCWIALLAAASRTAINATVWDVKHPGAVGETLVIGGLVASAIVAAVAWVRRWDWVLALAAASFLLLVVLAVTVYDTLIYRFTEADVGYGFLAAALVLLLALAVLTRGRFAPVFAAAAVAAGLMGFPFDRFPGLARARDREAFPGRKDVDRGLYDGLEWLRRRTSVDDVIAVDNYRRHVVGTFAPIFVAYSAFSERRVFLEGWYYTTRSWEVGASESLSSSIIPFPRRLRLNEAVFVRGDPNALRTLVDRFGVRYLVRDYRNGHGRADLGKLGKLVYRNPSVAIYAVRH